MNPRGSMSARLGYSLALCVAVCLTAFPSPVPAEPSPAPTFAPIGGDETPGPAPTASASPKLLGHVLVSAFCGTFVERFNVAARTMVADDARLDDAVFAIRGYEDDFSRLDGARSAWDHKLQLIAALGNLLETIPRTQAAVNDLRGQAKTALDPDRRAALVESAARLQESVDHQRIVADEMQAVVDIMLDSHSSEDTIAHSVVGILDPKQSFNVNPLDAPVPHPGDALPGKTPSWPRSSSMVEQVLRMPRDRRIIGDAEAGAAAAAARVVRTCLQEAKPAVTGPSPSP